MACTITIDETTLLATTDNAGQVVRIDVEGDADDCNEVGVSIKDDNAGVEIGPVFATPDGNGRWRASFVHGVQGIDLKPINCDDKVTVRAKCSKSVAGGAPCEAPEKGLDLPCKPGGEKECPRVTVVVTSGNCNAANTLRTVTFQVTVEGGAQIEYRWNFGDGTALTAPATGSGTFTQTHGYAAPASTQTYNANLIIIEPNGCTATPDPIQVVVAGCPSTTPACPDDPRFIAERHLPGGVRNREDIEAQCVPPGDYTISVSNSYPAGTTVFWTVDEVDAGTGITLPATVTVVSGETLVIEAIADSTNPDCPPRSEDLELTGCLADCSNDAELVLEKPPIGGVRERVPTDEGCIPPGEYVVRLIEPDAEAEIDWFANGVLVPGEHGRSVRITIEAGESLAVSALVDVVGCPDDDVLNPSLPIEACDCTADVSLTVFDADGDVVDPANCVAPGTYTVQASGSSVNDENAERTWRINGAEVPGNGTEREVRVAAPVTTECGSGAPATSVTFEASTPECTREAAVTLRPCAEYVFSVCCQALGFLVLLLFGLTTLAAALALCPLAFPSLAPFFTAFGLWIFLGFLLALVVAIIIWIWLSRCPLTWCHDILPKLWQGALMVGITFLYFGSCPACLVTAIGSLLIWGVIFLLIGAGLLLGWVLGCPHSRCETVWRIFELGVVSTIIGAIETVMTFLGPGCISLGAVGFLWVVTALIDLLGLGLPWFCGFNPIAPNTAFAAFRRPPPGPRRMRRRRLASGIQVARAEARSAGPRAQATGRVPRTKVVSKKKGCGCGG